MLDGPLETFIENIVRYASSTVHTDPDVCVFQLVSELVFRELSSLVRVEDFRPNGASCLSLSAETKVAVKPVREPPVPDGHEIPEALSYRYLGDVSAPDEVG